MVMASNREPKINETLETYQAQPLFFQSIHLLMDYKCSIVSKSFSFAVSWNQIEQRDKVICSVKAKHLLDPDSVPEGVLLSLVA